MRTKPPVWMWAVPIFTAGLLAPVPPFVIALRLQTLRAWTWFGATAAASVVGMLLVSSQPEGADNFWTNTGLLILLVNLVTALSYAGVVGKGVLWGQPPYLAPLPYIASAPLPPPLPTYGDPNAAAVAGVHAIRQKRSEARAIAQRDPQMARDLRIGRPDLPRNFDDGGLVDLNSAPVATIVQSLGLSEPQAAQLVDVRHSLGRFMQADDLLHLGGLDQRDYDNVRDRVILL